MFSSQLETSRNSYKIKPIKVWRLWQLWQFVIPSIHMNIDLIYIVYPYSKHCVSLFPSLLYPYSKHCFLSLFQAFCIPIPSIVYPYPSILYPYPSILYPCSRHCVSLFQALCISIPSIVVPYSSYSTVPRPILLIETSHDNLEGWLNETNKLTFLRRKMGSSPLGSSSILSPFLVSTSLRSGFRGTAMIFSTAFWVM